MPLHYCRWETDVLPLLLSADCRIKLPSIQLTAAPDNVVSVVSIFSYGYRKPARGHGFLCFQITFSVAGWSFVPRSRNRAPGLSLLCRSFMLQQLCRFLSATCDSSCIGCKDRILPGRLINIRYQPKYQSWCIICHCIGRQVVSMIQLIIASSTAYLHLQEAAMLWLVDSR